MRSKLLVLLGLSLVACRGGGDDTGDDQPPVDGTPGGLTIKDVQGDTVKVGDPVSLKGVIVTAIDAFGAKTGDMWIQDPGGGEFSGVKVFRAPLDVLATLQPGDIVDLSGAQKDEFALTSDMSGRTTTELTPAGGGMMTITKTGTGTVPAPAEVDAIAIAMKDQAGRDAEWEKWEGVLIRISGISQTGTVRAFGSTMPTPDDSFKFEVNGGLVIESLMAKFPTGAVPDFCYASLTGIGDYFFDHLLIPRSAGDYGVAGATCPTESGHASCSDGTDNDYDGFMDCADRSCQASDPACTTASSIANVQMGTVVGQVMLADVFVTARDDVGTSKGLWVADALQGAPNNGVFVFTGAALDATLVIGAKVNVQGTVSEFDVNPQMGDKVTEITNATVTLVPGAPGVPLPDTTATAAILGDIGAPGEPYEGVFVKVNTLKVTNPAAGFGKIELTDNNNNKITVDDDLFTIPAQTTGACLNVTGVMHIQLTENIRTMLPRSVADLAAGTGCN